MNQMILKANSAEVTMNSEQLADLLQIEHNELRKKANAMAAKGVIEFREESSQNPSGGRPRLVMHFDKRNSMIIAAKLNDRLLAAVVDRWMELEAQSSQPRELTRLELLQLAIDSEQQRLTLASALELAAPKAAFVDKYVQATGSMIFRQVAKLLQANEHKFRQFLMESHVMYRLNGVLMPYQAHIDAGRFEVKTGVSAVNNHAFSQPRFTAKGVEWIARLWGSQESVA